LTLAQQFAQNPVAFKTAAQCAVKDAVNAFVDGRCRAGQQCVPVATFQTIFNAGVAADAFFPLKTNWVPAGNKLVVDGWWGKNTAKAASNFVHNGLDFPGFPHATRELTVSYINRRGNFIGPMCTPPPSSGAAAVPRGTLQTAPVDSQMTATIVTRATGQPLTESIVDPGQPTPPEQTTTVSQPRTPADVEALLPPRPPAAQGPPEPIVQTSPPGAPLPTAGPVAPPIPTIPSFKTFAPLQVPKKANQPTLLIMGVAAVGVGFLLWNFGGKRKKKG